jgi:hypothetical protein
MTNPTLPGFTAEASVPQSTARHRAPRAAPVDAAVTPAQLDWSSLLKEGYHKRRVPADIDCPPGQAPTFVEGGSIPKYCSVTQVVYSYAERRFIEVTSEYQCGWTFVAPHWECQERRLRVFGG